MAKILQEEIGDKLFIPPHSRTDKWPSPSSLKGRIVIRDKLKHKHDKKGLAAEASSVGPGLFKSAKEVKNSAGDAGDDAAEEVLTVPDEDDEEDDDVDDDDSHHFSHSPLTNLQHSPSKVIETSLKSLVSVENAKFKTFEEAMVLDRKISCSWGEAKLRSRAQSTDAAVMTAFTERHLLRCYPAGHRIMSDNYDPSAAWSIGTQMVALNFQANDKPTWWGCTS
jgi:phosphatidylinositol phospholipase C delta